MTRPLYLADEVRARLVQYEVMMAALTRIADLCADGVVTLGQIEHLARAALAPPSERREGEPAWTMQGCPECHGSGKEGTGTPSGEGGEDFRECFRCQGTGFVPFPEPPAVPKEE